MEGRDYKWDMRKLLEVIHMFIALTAMTVSQVYTHQNLTNCKLFSLLYIKYILIRLFVKGQYNGYLSESEGTNGQGTKGICGAGLIFYFLTWVLVTWVCSL